MVFFLGIKNEIHILHNAWKLILGLLKIKGKKYSTFKTLEEHLDYRRKWFLKHDTKSTKHKEKNFLLLRDTTKIEKSHKLRENICNMYNQKGLAFFESTTTIKTSNSPIENGQKYKKSIMQEAQMSNNQKDAKTHNKHRNTH